MVTLNFTLYSFVCDVSTFTSLFAPDVVDGCARGAFSFVCQWSSVHRMHTSGATSVPRGATPPVSFRIHGSDMVLNFGSYNGLLELGSDMDVIVFFIKASNFGGGVAPVVAKGTLDPHPYVGKSSKKYAIKLRDGTGLVIGKLLFALEVRDGEEKQATMRAASQIKHLEHKPSPIEALSKPDTNSEPRQDRTRSAIPNSALQKLKDQQEVPKRLPVRQSASSSPQTQYGFTSQESNSEAACADAMAEHLDIYLEKIVVKNEAIDLENPPPLLLGGSYCLMVAFGHERLRTPMLICQNPKEVTCNHRVSFVLPAKSGEKLRFSLWEDKRQVGGFSLDPAKFCVSLGAKKEYCIPFRYFPTQHGVTLDVTVRRYSRPASDDAVMTKTLAETRSKSPPSSRKTQNYTENLSVLDSARRRPSEDAAAASNGTALGVKPHRRNSVHDYVKRMYSDSSARLTYWESATGDSTVDKRVHQSMKLRDDTPLSQTEPNTIYYKNDFNQYQEQSQHQAKQRLFASNPRDEASSRFDNGAPSPTGRAEWFLDQLAHLNKRSSSATRRPTSGLEVPSIVPNRRESPSRALGAPERPADSMRGGTPLCDRHGSNGRMSENCYDGDRGDNSDVKGIVYSDRNRDTSSRGESPWRRHVSQSDVRPESVRVSRDEQEPLTESAHSRLNNRYTYRTSLMEEWLDWRGIKSSSSTAQVAGGIPPSAESPRSVASRDNSVASIASRNRAASPLPTKSLGSNSEQKPFQPIYSPRSSSIGRVRPLLPIR